MNVKLIRIIVGAVLLAAAAIIGHSVQLPVWQMLLIYLVPYLVVGYDVVGEAFEGICHGEVFDEDFLMFVATVGAMCIGFLPGAEPQFAEAVFVMLFLSGASMNVGAMLAFVMLVGLVVNNNILVLEPTIARVKNGEDAKSALWTELNDKRYMVLMTSIAVITGMVPQLWSADGMKVAMAAVMIGGMLASLIFTFTLTPALFFLIERARRRLARNK